MTFLTENWEGIVALLVALHGVALAIVNLTPTPKDNELVGRVYRLIEFLAGIISPRAKQ